MAESTVIFKGNNDGITIVLDESVDFQTIKLHLKEKVDGVKSFFDNAKMSIVFKGRKLAGKEIEELVDIFKSNTTINITYVKDEYLDKKETKKEAINEKEDVITKYYRGTLRSGQKLVFSGSVVVLGDVNPGAEIFAEGNIIILGTLKGFVHAGYTGNNQRYVIALKMKPMQIKIGDKVAKTDDNELFVDNTYAQIVYVLNDKITIDKADLNSYNNL